MLLIVFQALVLYGATILWKISGEPWRDGTALYYVSQAREFAYRPLPDLVVANPFLVTLLTYSVVVSQIGIVILVISRWWPYLLLATVLALHGGIALSMGLVTFSLIILSVDTALVSDTAWSGLMRVGVEPELPASARQPLLWGGGSEPEALAPVASVSVPARMGPPGGAGGEFPRRTA